MRGRATHINNHNLHSVGATLFYCPHQFNQPFASVQIIQSLAYAVVQVRGGQHSNDRGLRKATADNITNSRYNSISRCTAGTCMVHLICASADCTVDVLDLHGASASGLKPCIVNGKFTTRHFDVPVGAQNA